MSISVSDIRSVSEHTVLERVVTAGRGKRSDARFEQPMWAVVRLRDELIVRVETYTDSAQALEAAGLSE
jgi:ketosteroid isomerase-like protein